MSFHFSVVVVVVDFSGSAPIAGFIFVCLSTFVSSTRRDACRYTRAHEEQKKKFSPFFFLFNGIYFHLSSVCVFRLPAAGKERKYTTHAAIIRSPFFSFIYFFLSFFGLFFSLKTKCVCRLF
jgi:hypothetical protein